MQMKIRFLIAFGYSLLLSACATTGTPEDTVQRRAQAHMDLVTAGQLLAAYEYLSPGYRSSVSPEGYIAQFVGRKVKWNKGTVESAECTENRCTVEVKLNSKVFAPVPGVSTFDVSDNHQQTWVKTRGQWWYVPKK
jgi:hypothetical protein